MLGRVAGVGLLVGLLVAVFGASGWAVADRGDQRATRPGPAAGSADGREDLERYRVGQERRRARRAGREAREQRRVSRRAYRRLSKTEALRLAREAQPELVESPVFDPLPLEAGDRVDRFVGETGAQIVGEDGERHAFESTLPLRSEVGEPDKRLVDLALEESGGALVAVNPLIDTVIDRQLGGGVRIGDGFTVRLESAGQAEAEVVADRAFFANALPDSDLVVMPTPKGVQVSLQVRSADAPEEAVLALDLPQGAQLRVIPAGPGTLDGTLGAGIPGSAEVVRGDELLAVIAPPVGWDADHEPLEGVRYSEDAGKLVVHYPHRSADLRYPLVVDPQIDRFRVNGNGGVITDGPGWVIGHENDTEAAAWNYNSGGEGPFAVLPAQAGYTYEHKSTLALGAGATEAPYANNAYGQWTWRAPRRSWVFRADFAGVYHSTAPPVMCLAMGLYSVTRLGWEAANMYNGYGTYVGQSPWRGGPPTEGSCNSQPNDNKAHISDSPSPGNLAVYQMFAYNPGKRSNFSYSQMQGASVHLEDAQAPTVSSATTTPGGWVRSATVTTKVNARDATPGTPAEQGGLGMFVDQLLIPVEGGGVAPQNVFGSCANERLTRCTESHNFTHTYSTEGDLDPNTAGNQRMPDGANTIYGHSYDATGKPTRYQAGTVNIDRAPPDSGTITGIAEGELARDRDYTITGTSTDLLSGSRSVQITLDGAEKARRDNCPATTNPCPLDWTLDGGDQALTEGTHTIRVNATDQAGNGPRTVATRTFKVERTPPEFELDGSLLPSDTGWVAAGEQDLTVDAFDAPSPVGSTGATYVEARIDGDSIGAPAQQPCESGGCEFEADFVKTTTELAEGQHTLTVVVRDGAGNTADSDPIPFKLERSTPDVALAGDLVAGASGTLERGRTYRLAAAATDVVGTQSQSGLGRLEVFVDGEQVAIAEQPCELGGCPQVSEYDFVVDDWEPGQHEISVIGTDLAGNDDRESLTVSTAEPPPPACQAAPDPEVRDDPIEEPPTFARQTVETFLPEAFQPRSSIAFADLVLQPALSIGDFALLPAADSLARGSVGTTSSGGAEITVNTDYAPVCFSPTAVSSNASESSSPINVTAALYANSLPEIDTVVRPTLVGMEAVDQIRSPLAAHSISWNVDLQPDQVLKQLSDGSVAVVEPAPEGDEPYGDDDVPAPPSLAEQRDALTDTGLARRVASDALERAAETTADEIIVLVPVPWAIDSTGRSVGTSLFLEGSKVTMTIPQPPAAGVYPVFTHREVAMADSLGEADALRADAETADYTYEEAEAFQPDPAGGDPVTEAGDPESPPSDDFEGEDIDETADLSAFAGDEFAPEDGTVDIGEENAGANAAALRDHLPSVGLTESHPALLFSPDRLRANARHLRPIVPWNIRHTIENKPPLTQRERLWTQWFNITQPPPQDALNKLGHKTPSERNNGIPSHVTMQFVTGKPAPTPSKYRKRISQFVNSKYQRVIQDFTPWNEPNLGKPKRNPTSKNPYKAARYWIIAQSICHPKGGRSKCGNVVAGEFVGTPSEQRIKRCHESKSGERHCVVRSYEDYYRRYLNSQIEDFPRKLQRPKVVGYHAYPDTSRYLLRKGPQAPTTERYVFDLNGKNEGPGTLNHPGWNGARIWLSAVGAYYHRQCSFLTEKDRRDHCEGPQVEKRDVLLYGMARQGRALAKLLKRVTQINQRIARHNAQPGNRNLRGISRFSYFALHNTKSAATYDPPGSELTDLAGRTHQATDFEGRGRGPKNDWGLIGSDNDAGYPSRSDNNVRTFKLRPVFDGDFSLPYGAKNTNPPRYAFCGLRDRRMQGRRRCKR